MPDELLPVATFVRPSEATAAKTALEAEGIRCFLKDENIISMDWLLGNAVGYVKLLVPAVDVERARALLDEPFDDWPAEAYEAPQSDESETDRGEEGSDASSDDGLRGPKCPTCDRPRVAICPYCQTTRSGFIAADRVLGDESADQPALVICPTCDEPFQPEYLRRCEWCGHDFGTGAEPPRIVRPMEGEPVNWRTVVAGLVGIVIVGAIVVYFAVLLS